jgi:hypothetical protein
MRSVLALVAFALAAVPATARADATDDRRALVMLRVLAYDKHLGARAGGDIRILIVHPDGDTGAAERARWTSAFTNARKLKVDGRSVVVSAHRFESATTLDRALATETAAVIVCDGLTAKLPVDQLAAVTRARHALSFTTREADVAKGLAVGLVPGKERDEIVVNVRAAAAEGVKFGAGLLQLARTVEGSP